MNRIVKLLLPFTLLFLMNVSIFKILATFGFQLTMNEKHMLSPSFAFIVLYIIHKQSGKDRKSL